MFSPRRAFPAERELRGKQVQVLRGPATVTDEPISDTTESTACAEDFGKVKAAFEFPARRPAWDWFFLTEDQKKDMEFTAEIRTASRYCDAVFSIAEEFSRGSFVRRHSVGIWSLISRAFVANARLGRTFASFSWTRILVLCWTRESGENPEHVESILVLISSLL